jgi:Fic family protein
MRFMYLWQSPQWPEFQVDVAALQPALSDARYAQGRAMGLVSHLQLMDLGELQLQGWADEAVATAQIEGEILHVNSVRASAARRLGLADAKAQARDERTEATLDDRVEKWLRTKIGSPVDFEVDDALAKLERLGVATRIPASADAGAETGDLWSAVPADIAAERLRTQWVKIGTR